MFSFVIFQEISIGFIPYSLKNQTLIELIKWMQRKFSLKKRNYSEVFNFCFKFVYPKVVVYLCLKVSVSTYRSNALIYEYVTMKSVVAIIILYLNITLLKLTCLYLLLLFYTPRKEIFSEGESYFNTVSHN